MFDKLKSRKLWMAVLAAVVTVLGDALGFSEVTQWIVGLIGGTYMVGQGIADAGKQGEAQAQVAAERRAESERYREAVAPQFQQPQPHYPPQGYYPPPQEQPAPRNEELPLGKGNGGGK